MTLRPDLEMYETDGNLEPIRHPEAQHVMAMMDEHGKRQEQLLALWKAAHAWRIAEDGEGEELGLIAIGDALDELGIPPE